MISIRIGVADIRTQPKFESERESQIIFGEKLSLIQNLGEYSQVSSVDGVTGFVKTYLLTESDEKKYKLKSFFDAGSIKFPFGSLLSDSDLQKYNVPINKVVKMNDFNYSVTDLALKFLGVPYLWGGTSDFGFDCSGFVQRLYRFVGKDIPRNSDQQRDLTTTVDDFSHALPGDLVFFKGHVALYLGDERIIHANGHSASVSLDNLFDNSTYSEQLLRILEKIGRVNK